jgi:hypothetical protein
MVRTEWYLQELIDRAILCELSVTVSLVSNIYRAVHLRVVLVLGGFVLRTLVPLFILLMPFQRTIRTEVPLTQENEGYFT